MESPKDRRRLGACVLVGGGVLALTVAALLPTYAVPKLMKIPLNIEANTLSEAPNSALIDVAKTAAGHATTETGVPLRFRVYVTVEDPSDSRIVTLQAATSMFRADRPESEGPISASVDRVTLDRGTGEPMENRPASIQTERDKPPVSAAREGFQYKFPFDTQRTSYPYFDSIARETRPVDYIDDDRVEDGMRLFHFSQKTGPVNLHDTQPDMGTTLSAAAWGLPGTEQIPFDLFYSNDRDIWVEPTSGSIVAEEDHLHRFLARTVDDPHALTTLDARTKFDQATLDHTVSLARDAKTKLQWGRIYTPIALAMLGVALLGLGLLLGVKSSRRRPEARTAADSVGPDQVNVGASGSSSTVTPLG